MKLEVKNIVYAPVGESQNFSVDLKNEKIDEEILIESVCGEVKVTKLEEMLFCDFNLKIDLKLTCDRCLSEFIFDKDIKFKEEFYLSPQMGEEVYLVSKDDRIEVGESIREEILSTIPVKKLCKIDCRGICSSCGEDLNVKKCKCNN